MDPITRTRAGIGKLLALLYWLGGFVYMVYSTVTATGPGGWLIDLQMRWFDRASLKATVFVLFVVWLAAGIGGHAVWEWVFGRHDDDRVSASERRRERPPRTRPHNRSWARLVLGSAAVAAIGGLGYLMLASRDALDQREAVHRIDLLSEPAVVLEGRRFVQLTAAVLHEHAFIYTEGKTHQRHRIVPLVAAHWTPDQPVQLLFDAGEAPVGRALQQVPVELSRNDLPAFATGALERRGLKLAAPYYLARRADLSFQPHGAKP